MSDSSHGAAGRRFGFGPFVFDPAAALLLRDEDEVELPPRALRVLQFLLEHRGRVVGREEILDAVWVDAVVGEESLTEAIGRIREALGDDPKASRYVRTLPRRGYRFVAPVFDPDATPAPPAPSRRLAALAVAAGLALALLLGWPAAVDERPDVRSLAVLPFENLSSDPSTDFFAAGMTAALIDALGRDGRLEKVISRTSVQQYRDSTLPLPGIAAELGVDGIVEAAIMRADDRVRISARLLHGPTETPLWSRSYERELVDVLDLVAEVAGAIAEEIAAEVSTVGAAPAAPRYPPEAHDRYLHGLLQTSDYTIEGYRRAAEHFEAAIALEPAHAPAHAMLAFALYTLAQPLAVLEPREAMPRARLAAEEALRLDGDLPEGHAALAWILMVYQRDFDAAERHFRRAIEINPSHARAHLGLAYLFAHARGQPARTLASARRARELAPLDTPIWLGTAEVAYAVRAFDEALALANAALERQPGLFRAILIRRWVFEAIGADEAAFEAHLAAVRVRGGSEARLAEIRAAWERGGLAAVWRHRLASRAYREPTEHAEILAMVGEREAALDLLEEAVVSRPGILLFLNYPRWDSIRDEPRFRALRDLAGVPAAPGSR